MLIAQLPVTHAFLDLAVLTGYNHRGIDFNPEAATDPGRTGPAVTCGWVLATRSNACPRCLQQNGIWPTRWRLLWSAVCCHHKVGLIETCPKCVSPMMNLRNRLDIVPGVTSCHCGYNLGLVDATTASPTLLQTQLVLDAAMEGHSVELAGDELTSQAFFVVFRTLAELIRSTGYDLDGKSWAAPQPLRSRQISTLRLDSIREILERTGRIFALTAQDGQIAARELRRRAAPQSIQVAWRFTRNELEPSRIGRIGRILSTRASDL